MKLLSVFTPRIAPYVIGCPEPLIEQKTLDACIDFCARSLIVQLTSNQNAVADLSEYDVEEPSMLQLVRPLAVFFRRQRLTARAKAMVTDAVAAYGEAVAGETIASGTPSEWFVRDLEGPTVSIYPPPELSEDDAVTITAAFQPTLAATRVPDILYDDYAADIAAGALYQLMLMPQQPWSNPPLALQNEKRFNAAISGAAALARTGLGTGSLRVRPRSFV